MVSTRRIAFYSLFVLFVYLATSFHNTVYNHFVLLADAFLKGRFWISADAPWLEKIPIDGLRFYVANPPMPAILAMPFVAIFGTGFPQNYLSSMAGALVTFFVMIMARKMKPSWDFVFWAGLLASFGNIIWFLSSSGSTWYFGQVCAVLFLTIALVESMGAKRTFLVGLAIGASYLSRIDTIVGLPIFIYLLKDRFGEKRNVFLFVLGMGGFLIFNAYYNFSRFGVIWDKGYLLIPGVLTEPWYSHGILHPIYIPNNLKVAFLSFPKLIGDFPYLVPSWGGLAVWITTPSFVFAAMADSKLAAVRFAFLSIILIALVVFMHGNTGYAQFGYRFAVDFYPFLFFVTLKGVLRSRLRWYHWLLLFIGVFVNAWGVVLINKFNLVLP